MTMPTYLDWHEAPDLPPWEGEEVAVLAYNEAAASFDVHQFNWQPGPDFLIGVDRWAMLWPVQQHRAEPTLEEQIREKRSQIQAALDRGDHKEARRLDREESALWNQMSQ